MSLITLVSTWMLALALAVGQADAQPLVRFVMLVRAAVARPHGVPPPEPVMTPATDSDHASMARRTAIGHAPGA